MDDAWRLASYLLSLKRAVDPESWVEEAADAAEMSRNYSMI